MAPFLSYPGGEVSGSGVRWSEEKGWVSGVEVHGTFFVRGCVDQFPATAMQLRLLQRCQKVQRDQFGDGARLREVSQTNF